MHGSGDILRGGRLRLIALLLGGVLACGVATPAPAQSPARPANDAGRPEAPKANRGLKLPTRDGRTSEADRDGKSSAGGSIATTAASLVVVLAIIGGAAWGLKRWSPRGGQSLPGAAVEILGQRPLDTRTRLQVVRCGSRILILGLSADGARTLSEITEPDEVALLVGACRPAAAESSGPSFRTLFEQHAGWSRPSRPQAAPYGEATHG